MCSYCWLFFHRDKMKWGKTSATFHKTPRYSTALWFWSYHWASWVQIQLSDAAVWICPEWCCIKGLEECWAGNLIKGEYHYSKWEMAVQANWGGGCTLQLCLWRMQEWQFCFPSSFMIQYKTITARGEGKQQPSLHAHKMDKIQYCLIEIWLLSPLVAKMTHLNPTPVHLIGNFLTPWATRNTWL